MSETPEKLVQFSVFLLEVSTIFKRMSPDQRLAFRKAVAVRCNSFPEPGGGWEYTITNLIKPSSTKLSWTKNYWGDLLKYAGKIERTIAFYYYLHSLTEDNSHADLVDKTVFFELPGGPIYWHCHNTPVFIDKPKSAPEKEDTSWKTSLHRWELTYEPSKPADLRLASLAIEPTQSSSTHEPLALIASVHVMPAYEVESGIELRFKSVDVIIQFDANNYSSKLSYLNPSDWSFSFQNARFCQSGASTAPYVTLVNEDGVGLKGLYTSDTLLVFHPNHRDAKFEASLEVNVLETNAVFPEDMVK